MQRYGDYGKPILLFESYIEWREDLETQTDLIEADTKADFASFLFGPVRQSLWHGYEMVQGQYQKYARVENAPDFRERRLRGLNGMSKPGYVGDHGQLPVLSRSERPSAALVVDTYGGQYSITRQAIINDETNELLNSAPAEMGEAAGVFIVETIIAYIESNPTAPDGVAMFHSSRGNTATAALSEDSLVDGVAWMTKQLDDDGRRIVVRPRVLAVGSPRQELIARRILNSQLAGTTITTAGAAGAGSQVFDKGTDNVVRGIVSEVVYDPYWNDANDWYLFADPSRVPAFATGFLNGQERPMVYQKDPEKRAVLGGGGQDPYTFDLLSIDFEVIFDFGVAAVDPRGGYRSVVS
jgi:hypothetical protein